MKNPLRKRLLRELRQDAGKYLVIFLLMVLTIGFVSGFLVADGSMIVAYNGGFEKYNIENGHFSLGDQMNRYQERTIEEEGISLYDLFYMEKNLENGSHLRIFPDRKEVNLVCLMKGTMPARAGEIALDRMYADNNGIVPGDRIQVEDSDRFWTVTGLVALPDYSCLFEDNNDAMFDSVKFGVAIVTPEEFESLGTKHLVYNYAWKYDTEPATTEEEKKVSEDLMNAISQIVQLDSYVPRYANQAIQFTGEDMGSDRNMMIALLYIMIGIMAFVFGVTTQNTIAKEACVIGTLRATGYTRGELIRHYMTAPLVVTLVGALLGNLLGYTVLKDICVQMYYGSYSLPTYVTVWSSEAFWLTTVVPFLLMAAINFLLLFYKLQLSPLKFLRRDLGRKKNRRAMPLSSKIPFFWRFHLRVIFQNMGNYMILFVGILFANLLLLFGLVFPDVLTKYQASISDYMLCDYQYMLKLPVTAEKEERKLEQMLNLLMFSWSVETDQEGAEPFSAYSLKTPEGGNIRSEEVTLYGVQKNSAYMKLDLTEDSGDHVYISSAYEKKYDLHPGDTFTLREAYEDKTYDFYVEDVYPYDGGICIFMDQNQLNTMFDMEKDFYCGYFSNEEITDIDDTYIGTVIDEESMTKISRQLLVSMGGMMSLVSGFAVIIFLVLIYLLSKIIIEKNSLAISMTKILGYKNGEVSRLYILPTSLVVIAFLLLSLPIEGIAMQLLYKVVLINSISGWIPFTIAPKIYLEMFLLGFCAYALVVAIEYRRVRHIPMDEALKTTE